ncbi:MAG: DUF933 domain-containing protein [Polyangiaceae bacterium]
MIRTGYDVLGLITYFTAGKMEVRAWTIPRGARAPQAAGVIHTDFRQGFIKAEVIWWSDFALLGSEAKCRDAGSSRWKAKSTSCEMATMHFRFNVDPVPNTASAVTVPV